MKSYTITVNGNVYDVSVEEGISANVAAKVAPEAAPKAAPVSVPKAAPTAVKPNPNGAQGSVKVNSPMPGKILAVKASVGQVIKKGEVIIILEAMKMENEMIAEQDGTLASINVAVGDMVEAGDVLATLN